MGLRNIAQPIVFESDNIHLIETKSPVLIENEVQPIIVFDIAKIESEKPGVALSQSQQRRRRQSGGNIAIALDENLHEQNARVYNDNNINADIAIDLNTNYNNQNNIDTGIAIDINANFDNQNYQRVGSLASSKAWEKANGNRPNTILKEVDQAEFVDIRNQPLSPIPDKGSYKSDKRHFVTMPLIDLQVDNNMNNYIEPQIEVIEVLPTPILIQEIIYPQEINIIQEVIARPPEEEIDFSNTDFYLKFYIDFFEVTYKLVDDFGAVFKPYILISIPGTESVKIPIYNIDEEKLNMSDLGGGNMDTSMNLSTSNILSTSNYMGTQNNMGTQGNTHDNKKYQFKAVIKLIIIYLG